ncbi:helicase DnaB [Kitasatospora aureofaciens]|uniref:DnaB-like helicase N-terminal domain-containing protein n=1 Tax=Kitasatospora aureofaciens TaxID=1894 RepID=UPI001C47E296|nr:DnaB-like helicase N-terminal domain-containing protein [Kitasatospora aureofaciens]MBV6695554.1 helicase DnaB [Kitasatospora aureofaciens]
MVSGGSGGLQLEAEQALLGALLLAPPQLDSVASWLEPSHFYRHAHAALYEVLLAQRAAGHPGLTANADEEQRRDWALGAMSVAAEASRGMTPGYGGTLMAACPVSSHAGAYGRMVLEGAIRRRVHERAHRLQHAARTGSLEGALELTGELREAIHELASSWGSLDERPRPLPGPWPLELTDGVREKTLQHESAMLSSATASPDGLVEITRWLRPGDFLDAGHRAVYQALAALAHRAEPIDQLTVLWEAQHRGAIASGTITADGVRAVTRGGLTGDPQYWAERVLRASLLRQSAASAGVVRLLAGDSSLPGARLLGSALHALGAAEAVQDRWRTANNIPRRSDPPPAPAVAAERRRAASVRTPVTVPNPGAAPSPAREAASPRAPIRSTR